MKKVKSTIFLLIFGIILFINTTLTANASCEQVYIGGIPAGFIINTNGAEVVGICEVNSLNEKLSPSKEAGIEIGDVIIKLNDKKINKAKDIENALKNYNNLTTNITIKRNNDILIKSILPLKDKVTNKYKIGLFVRDSMTGIGTLTFIKKDTMKFGALGHPVLNQENSLVNIDNGEVYKCNIIGINKGVKGKAGELRGLFIKTNKLGKAEKNTNYGIFGQFKDISYCTKDKLISADSSDAKPGKAKIVTTVSGNIPKEYSINIVKVDKNDKYNKHLVLKITDDELLNATGGIVQGMSGSPIMQDGKLIGAVTHVFLNDPTRGFGILINKMLNE